MQAMICRSLFALAVSSLAGLANAAADFQYFVIPIGGITGISQSATSIKSDKPSVKYSGMINEKYADIFFDSEAQNQLISRFKSKVVNAFPTSVVGPNQIVTQGREGKYAYLPYDVAQCSPNFKVGYKDAYAIAIGISRLSTYFNTYSNFTQVLVPITYTIRFVKLDGASVIFSKSETIYTQLSTTTSDFFASGSTEISPENTAKLKAAILEDGLKMIERQVDFAARSFSPKQTKISVIGRDQEYIMFDHGSEVGFVSGEDFESVDKNGNDVSFTVKYATDQLAIAVAANFPATKKSTNALREGDSLEFSFTKQGKDDAKPSVLAVQYTSIENKDLSSGQTIDNALQTILADDIGFKAPFNLIKQDPDFVRLKVQIASEANCDSSMFKDMNGFADNSTKPRQDPDLLLKLDHANSPVFSIAGVGGVTIKNIFSSAVTLSLIDKSNVTRQVFIGSDNYELTRTGGKGIAQDQAEEVNLKNASLVALKSLLEGFSLTQKTVAIRKLSGSTVTLSEVIPLSVFKQMRLVRPLSIAKTGKVIYLPIPMSEAQLERPTQDTATYGVKLDQMGDQASSLKQSDLVVFSGSVGNNRPMKLCEISRKRVFMATNLKNPSGFESMFGRIIGASVKNFDLLEDSPIYLQSVVQALKEGHFESTSLSVIPDSPFCLLPMEVQQLPKSECANAQCSGNASVGSGIRVFERDTKIAESLAAAKFDFSEIKEDGLSQFIGVKSFEHQLSTITQHKSKLQ